MGNCTSYGSGFMKTAKLILLNGELEEFSYPVKVSDLLQRNPDCFICNSDEMEFDGIVSAMDVDEELQPGQLYFELPVIFLTQRLHGEDMASLAVKASSALSTRSDEQMMKYGCHRPYKRVVDQDLFVFFHAVNVKVKSRTPVDYCVLRLVNKKRPAGRTAAGVGKCKVSKFTATLSAILEVEE